VYLLLSTSSHGGLLLRKLRAGTETCPELRDLLGATHSHSQRQIRLCRRNRRPSTHLGVLTAVLARVGINLWGAVCQVCSLLCTLQCLQRRYLAFHAFHSDILRCKLRFAPAVGRRDGLQRGLR